MAKTANAYVPDQGEVEVEISAANVTAIAAFTTAEAIVIDGAVLEFNRTNSPEQPFVETPVTGDDEPIVTTGKTIAAEQWRLLLVDDYFEGAAGEWGTDLLAAVEIFHELHQARQHPAGFQCTPAGGATGDIEVTLLNPKVRSCGLPAINSRANGQPATVEVMITASGHTVAAHA